MPKYRKRPVVVEAFQMTAARRRDNREWPNWLHDAWQKDPSEGAMWSNEPDETDCLYVGSRQGVNKVSWGDWIILNGPNDIYACKPDIFKATYELVEEAAHAS